MCLSSKVNLSIEHGGFLAGLAQKYIFIFEYRRFVYLNRKSRQCLYLYFIFGLYLKVSANTTKSTFKQITNISINGKPERLIAINSFKAGFDWECASKNPAVACVNILD